MNGWTDGLLILLVLTNLRLLGTSRLVASIRVVAVQGIALGILPLVSGYLHVPLVAIVSIILKGIVFPWLLMRSLRETKMLRELQPFVGYTASLLVGVLLLAAALWMSTRLPFELPAGSSLLVPAALFTIMVGLFMIVSRRTAITQVLGYLSMENGIYAFGMAFSAQEALLVEMGILLDAFMAVFVMGIAIFHINREFDHIEVDQLDTLKG